MGTTPKVRLITYASRAFRHVQRLNSRSARRAGGFDRCFAHGPGDIDRDFRARHADILSAARGDGYWLWKPYLIQRHLNQLEPDEWLMYCDAGAVFVQPPTALVEHAAAHDSDVLVFELEPFRLESLWTKRDAFVLLDCDKPACWASPQRIGGYSLWRRSDETRELVDAWLQAVADRRLVSDDPNTCGLENLPGFVTHRHDQSILSLLTKIRGIRAARDPSQFGNPWIGLHPDSLYPQIVESLGAVAPRWSTQVRRIQGTVERRIRNLR